MKNQLVSVGQTRHRQESKPRSYSAFNIDFNVSQKDKRIHSTKKPSAVFTNENIKTYNQTSCSGAQTWRRKSVISKTEHSPQGKNNAHYQTELYEEQLQSQVKKHACQQDNRRYTFGVLAPPFPQKSIPILSNEKHNKRLMHKKQSLICAMMRNQIKKKNDQERFRQRRIKALSQ